MRAMVLGAYFLFTVWIVLCRVYFSDATRLLYSDATVRAESRQ
jgi:hypothetical protein